MLDFLQAVHAETPHLGIEQAWTLNYISHTVHEIILDGPTYEEPMDILQATYQKPKNEIFSRHKLATQHLLNGESLEQYFKELSNLTKDCNFQPMNAKEMWDEHILDAFINSLQNAQVRQRFLENTNLNL